MLMPYILLYNGCESSQRALTRIRHEPRPTLSLAHICTHFYISLGLQNAVQLKQQQDLS